MQVSKSATYEARLGDVFRTLNDVLRRRRVTLLAVAAIVTALGIGITMMLPRYYTGTTLIQIDPSRNPLAHTGADTQAALASEGIETEVEVLTSHDLARAVVTRLKLLNDPEYADALANLPQGANETAKVDLIANALEKRLTIDREKLTYVISVTFKSKDPVKAARIANEFAAAYLDSKVNSNIGTAVKQSAFYDSQLSQLAADARAADQKVAQFQAASGLVGAHQTPGTVSFGTATDQQIGPLSIQLASAQALAADVRSKEVSARAMVAQNRLDLISSVRTDVSIQDLRKERTVLVDNLADMESRYGDQHPDLIKVRDQIVAIDNQIHLQALRVVAGLKSDADASEAQAASLRNQMTTLEQKQVKEAEAGVEMQSLQRDADSKHAAYDRMAQATLDTRQAAQNSIAQAQVISVAQTPQLPSSPVVPLMVALSLIAGLGAGLAVITTQEIMSSGLNSVDGVEGELGIPLLAAIPNVLKTERPADILIEKPTSQFAEALRNARASIIGMKAEDAPKIIAITSAVPHEGKTTTALGLARTMAIAGTRTIIVDADVRRAQLRQIIDVAPDILGTVEVLHGDLPWRDALIHTGMENLDTILVRAPYFSSEDLFGGDAMHRLLSELSAEYDAIVLDLPPLVGLADGRFLAALADAVVLAVKWNATPTAVVKSAVTSLVNDGANVVGAVFTMVDTSSQSVGSYYYYSNKYTQYYQPN